MILVAQKKKKKKHKYQVYLKDQIKYSQISGDFGGHHFYLLFGWSWDCGSHENVLIRSPAVKRKLEHPQLLLIWTLHCVHLRLYFLWAVVSQRTDVVELLKQAHSGKTVGKTESLVEAFLQLCCNLRVFLPNPLSFILFSHKCHTYSSLKALFTFPAPSANKSEILIFAWALPLHGPLDLF